jgi:RHH-type transcriptional regulator, proline utilization regulon repressor / proline dehydrogenase / delta 1-pyrroline-5-carboxylate dehydrogenase
VSGDGLATPFANEPVLELRRASERDALTGALAALDGRLPFAVPVLIEGQRGADSGISSTDPGGPDRIVATAGVAGEAEVDAAVEAAAQAGHEWAARGASERARVLLAAAAILRERRLELAALEVRECGKPWAEADADVCEAIDFLSYYARGALELERGPDLIQVAGERNSMRYAPRGVAAVISPWNFPIAIPAGMTSAALAAGNAVVLKPAEQSPGCALRLVEALHEAGVPRGALALLPGEGETGAALVRHPGVHVIAFTGSSAVGLEIIAAAATTPPGQAHVKRVVAEMGGKNCVIVDADADLDEVVPAVIRSAFAYAGQKCSACARVIAHEAVADELTERLGGAVATLEVGQAERFGVDVPPVIERAAAERVDGYRAEASAAGRLVAHGGELPSEGWFCSPALVADLPAHARVLREEVFGPLLTVEAAAGIDDACERVEALPFALTGGLFARNPDTVARIAARLPVGNLYVNRHITGAMVGRQPFGGNRLSGIGAKAGGPDYLAQFTESRALAENTMRQGLVVD